jgi:hypothetical protein
VSTELRGHGTSGQASDGSVYSWCGLQPTLIHIPAALCASPESHCECVLARHDDKSTTAAWSALVIVAAGLQRESSALSHHGVLCVLDVGHGT